MASTFPLRAPAGEVFAVGHVIMDVTEQVRTRERLSLAYELSNRIGSSLDVTHTADELADAVVPEFADEVVVELLPEVPSGRQLPPADRLERSLLQQVAFRSVRPGSDAAGPEQAESDPDVDELLERALHEYPLFEGALVQAAGAPTARDSLAPPRQHSRVVLPLSAGGALLGFTVLTRHAPRPSFDDEDLMLARHIAEHAAASLDDARRYTAERAVALTLQDSLASSCAAPQSAVEAATRYLPVSDETGLGATGSTSSRCRARGSG
jgi:GAF domain-containing protein